MYLKKVDKHNIEGMKWFKRTKLFALIDDFKNSEADAVEVVGVEENYKNVSSAQASFSKAIKHFGFRGILTIQRNGKLFLVKDDETEGETEEKD